MRRRLGFCAFIALTGAPTARAEAGTALSVRAPRLGPALDHVDRMRQAQDILPPPLDDLGWLRAETIEQAGFDLEAPARMTLTDRGLWRFEARISDGDRFDAWAQEHAQRRVDFAPGPVWVVDPERPTGCFRTSDHVQCQIGVDDRGFSDLAEAQPAPWPPSAVLDPILVEIELEPKALRAALTRRFVQAHRHAARYLDAEGQARAAERARRRIVGWTEPLTGLNRVQAWAHQDPERVHLSVSVHLDPSGRREVERWVTRSPMPAELVAWAQAPAIAGGWARLSPSQVAPWVSGLTELPPSALRGGMAWVVFGVDGGCPLSRPKAPDAWRFALPSALAVPVAETSTIGPTHGTWAGAPFEVELQGETLWIGTGRGAGSAVRRRRHQSLGDASVPSSVLARLHVDVAALRAALEAAHYGASLPIHTLQAVERRGVWNDLQVVRAELRRPRPDRIQLDVDLH